MGNDQPKCVMHDEHPIVSYCPLCNAFGCSECNHESHARTRSVKSTLAVWNAEIGDALSHIRECSYAFNNVEDSIKTMRETLHDLYYSEDAQMYYDAFEELVPCIRHQAMLLKHGLETIANYAVYMQRLLNAWPQNPHKITDFWQYWTGVHGTAEIHDDIDEYMVRLQNLQYLIQSKEDDKVIKGFREVKLRTMVISSRLMSKYASTLCRVEDTGSGFSWRSFICMTQMNTILQYDNIPPQIAYMLRILINGTIYMCGNKAGMSPTNELLTVPLVKNESRVLFSKKPTLRYIYAPTLAQVLNRYILLMGGDTSEAARTAQCYDIVQDRWMLFPCVRTSMVDKLVMVFNERWVYVRFSDTGPVYAVDMLDIEAGWVEASPAESKDKRRYLYVTADGRRFGSPCDRKYWNKQTTCGEVTIHGCVYREEMVTKGMLTVHSALTGQAKKCYYPIV